MKALAELYVQQFKTSMATMFQYRASIAIWMIGQVLEPLVYLVVWSIVSNNNSGGSVGGYTARDFAGYYIVFMLVNQITYTWVMYEMEWRIREGVFSFALLKPVHPIHSDIAANLSSKLITLPIMIMIAAVFAAAFHATISPQAWAIAVFIPALVLAYLVRFLIEWTVAQTAFWTTRVTSVNQMYYVLILFLSGQIAPLSLLPHPLQIVAAILPFRWMISFPVQLMLGQLTLGEALIGLGAQAAWLIASLVLIRIVWRAGVRVYSAVGG